jgi:hypothetical protein
VSLLGDMLAMGERVLAEVAAPTAGQAGVAGTLTAPAGSPASSSGAFTGARFTQPVDRAPGGGNRDNLTAALRIPTTGFAGVPLRDSRLTITGDSRAWLVVEADPVAPGGTTIGYQLELASWANRDEED